MTALASAYVEVKPDFTGFAEKLKAKFDEAVRSGDFTVPISFKLDTARVKTQLSQLTKDQVVSLKAVASVELAKRKLDDVTRDRQSKINADAKTDMAKAALDATSRERVAKIKADADTEIAKAKLDALARDRTVKVDADTSSAEKKLTSLADKMQKAGGPGWLGPAILALPAFTSLLGVATGAAVGLAGAFATTGLAVGAFAAVAIPVLKQAETAQQAVEKAQNTYNAAIASGVKPATAYKAEQLAINKAYAGMSPQQIALSKQLGNISDAWTAVKKAETPVIAGALQPWLKTITPLIKDLAPIIAKVAPVIQDLGVKMGTVVNSPDFKKFVDFIAGTGSSGLKAVGGTMIDLIKSFIILLPQFKPLIDATNRGIADFGAKVLAWSQSKKAADDIQKFLQWFHDNGPGVADFLKNVGLALKAVAPGLTAGGAIELHILSDFFSFIAKLPPSFAKPITEIVGALLLANKLGVVKLGVQLVSKGGALLKFLSGGAIDIGAGGMQKAGDTMVTAAAAMQRAADTMVGADAGAGGGGAGAAAGGAGLASKLGAILGTVVRGLGWAAIIAAGLKIAVLDPLAHNAHITPAQTKVANADRANAPGAGLATSIPFIGGDIKTVGNWIDVYISRPVRTFLDHNLSDQAFQRYFSHGWSIGYEHFQRDFAGPVTHFFNTFPGAVNHAVAKAFDDARHNVAQWVNDARRQVGNIFDGVRHEASHVFADVRHDIARWTDDARHTVAHTFDDIRHAASHAFDNARHDAAVHFDGMRHDTAHIFDDIRHSASAAFDTARHETAVVFDGWRHDAAHIWDNVSHDASTAFDNARHGTANTFDSWRHDASHIFDDMGSGVAGALAKIGSTLQGWLSTAEGWISHLWDSAGNAPKLPTAVPGAAPGRTLPKAAGGIIYAALGGAVGTDTVHAMLTPGERVLSVPQVAKLGGHDAITQHLSTGGVVGDAKVSVAVSSSKLTDQAKKDSKTVGETWAKAGTKWFDSGKEAFKKQLTDPVTRAVEKDIPAQFAKTVPHYYDAHQATLKKMVSDPALQLIQGTIPQAQNRAVTHWYDTHQASLKAQVTTPVTTLINSTVPAGWKTSITKWFPTVEPTHNTQVAVPLNTFYKTTLPTNITTGFKGAMTTVGGVANRDLSALNAVTKVAGITPIGNLNFSLGGTMPGYEPGRDTMSIMVGGGEGILVPEAVQGIGGAAAIGALNRKFAGYRGAGFADGGTVAAYATGVKNKYTWGGAAPPATDCSGFSANVYEHFGLLGAAKSGRWGTSETQYTDRSLLMPASEQPGAMVFFAGSDGTNSAPGHVGISLGSGKYVGADGPQGADNRIEPESGNVGWRVPKKGWVGGVGGVLGQLVTAMGKTEPFGKAVIAKAGGAAKLVAAGDNPVASALVNASGSGYATGGTVPDAINLTALHQFRGMTQKSVTAKQKAEAAALAALSAGGNSGLGAGSTGGTMSPRAVGATWTKNGGAAGIAPVMAAIAMRESGDHPSIKQQGVPPGLTGWGLWQITPTSGIWNLGQGHDAQAKFGNLQNADNNAKAAVYLLKGSGGSLPGPWASSGGLPAPAYASGGVVPSFKSGGTVNNTIEADGYIRAWERKKGGIKYSAYPPTVLQKQIDGVTSAFHHNNTLSKAGGLTAGARKNFHNLAAGEGKRLTALKKELSVLQAYRYDLMENDNQVKSWITAAGNESSLAESVRHWKAQHNWNVWRSAEVKKIIGLSHAQDVAAAAAAKAKAAAALAAANPNGTFIGKLPGAPGTAGGMLNGGTGGMLSGGGSPTFSGWLPGTIGAGSGGVSGIGSSTVKPVGAPSSYNPAGGNQDIINLLKRLVKATEVAPQKTAGGVGLALNGVSAGAVGKALYGVGVGY